VIGTDDVTPQARQALSINGKQEPIGSSGSNTSSGANTTASTDLGGHTSPADNGGGDASSPQPVTTAAVTPQNQVIDDVNTPLSTVIQTISNFVNGGTHLASEAASLTGNAVLQSELASFFSAGNSSLKVVFFDSNASVPDVFLFSTGVVFIEEKDIAPSLQMSNGGGTLTLQVDSHGGTVTLVGVATVTEQHTVVSV
jgi:hypothetical protein